MSVDEQAIATLLAQSRTAHSQYQQAKSDRRMIDARAQLQIAADRRQLAHDSDPTRSAPAWREDAISGDHAEATHEELHAQLTEFYATQLAR